MKKKYIKLFGANGSGKTATARKLGEFLTGQACDYWQANLSHNFRHHYCDCERFAAMGKWETRLKCCGMDAISAQKDFNYADKIKDHIGSIKGTAIVEEGLVTSSMRIHYAINEVAELHTFLLRYPPEVCRKRIEENRGGRIKEKNLMGKYKGCNSAFKNLELESKTLLDGSMEENVAKIIEVANLIPCNCMKSRTVTTQKELF